MILDVERSAWRYLAAGPSGALSHLALTPAAGDMWTAGPVDLLRRSPIGLFCSSKCPGSIVLKTFDAIASMRDEGRILIGGFHSLMEWECLGILLRGHQPIIWAPARSICGMRLKPELEAPFRAGRLLVISPFVHGQKRVTATLAEQRNQFVAALSDRLFIPHVAPGGRIAALAAQMLAERKEVWTIDDPSNRELISLGAVAVTSDLRRADRAP